jgi:hypothetical protein
MVHLIVRMYSIESELHRNVNFFMHRFPVRIIKIQGISAERSELHLFAALRVDHRRNHCLARAHEHVDVNSACDRRIRAWRWPFVVRNFAASHESEVLIAAYSRFTILGVDFAQAVRLISKQKDPMTILCVKLEYSTS